MSIYKILDIEAGVSNIIKDRKLICVSGGYFGDEAKGKTVANIAPYVGAIARVNSGENAGHTVYKGEKKFVFHLVPSGILTGKPNFIGENCVMDPISLMENEIKQLIREGINYNNLTVGNCYIVMPWHKVCDLAGSPNSSTGKGMSPVHEDIVGKRGIKLFDFLNNDKVRVSKSFDHWMALLNGKGINLRALREKLELNPKVPKYIIQFLELEREKAFDFCWNLFKEVLNSKDFPKLGNSREELDRVVRDGKKVLLEGPQSFYLSNNETTHVSKSTSARTNPSGIFSSSGLSPTYRTVTVNVLKVPSSRVGAGSNPSGYVHQNWFSDKGLTREDLENLNLDFNDVYTSFIGGINSEGILKETKYSKDFSINEAMAIVSCLEYGEYGATTGKPRICGSLDLPHIKHLVKFQNKKISISCMDRLDGLNKVPLVVGYKYIGEGYISGERKYSKGDILDLKETLPDENVLIDCIPIYKLFDGWKSSKNTLELDPNLEVFLSFIEDSTGAKIVSFGNGPGTNEMVYIQRN